MAPEKSPTSPMRSKGGRLILSTKKMGRVGKRARTYARDKQYQQTTKYQDSTENGDKLPAEAEEKLSTQTRTLPIILKGEGKATITDASNQKECFESATVNEENECSVVSNATIADEKLAEPEPGPYAGFSAKEFAGMI